MYVGVRTASRTASRFRFCQPFSDPLRRVRVLHLPNEYGIYSGFGFIENGFEARRSIQLSYKRASSFPILGRTRRLPQRACAVARAPRDRGLRPGPHSPACSLT